MPTKRTHVERLDLRERHEAFMAQVKADGQPITTYSCPACKKDVEIRKPPKRGEVWDTCRSCPYCEDVHFIIVRSTGPVRVLDMQGNQLSPLPSGPKTQHPTPNTAPEAK